MAVPSQFNNRLAPLGAFGTEFDTFTGLAEETILGNAISVNYRSDQDTMLTLQQAPDGVNWYIQDQKLLVGNEEHIFQHPAVLQFFRVIIQNRGLIDQEFGDLVTSLVQIQTNNIGVVATIGDITPSKDGVLTYGLSGASPLAMRVDASGSLITTSTATGASAASVTAWGKDALGASYPLPLTTGGAEIAMSITDPLPTGTNTIGTVKLEGTFNRGVIGIETLNPTVYSFTGGEVGQNPVALVTTMDARQGGASTTICGLSEEDREFEFISCIKTGDNVIGPINALHTYVDNLPAVQDISGTVTVASITAPLPAGTNKVGAVGISGLWNDGATDTEVQATMVKFPYNNFGGDGQPVGMVTTMDALYGKASVNVWALDDRYDLIGSGEPGTLTTRYIPSTQSAPYTNYINSLHTWVDNLPSVQDISGTVTVASITEPLPAGANTMGAVKIEGVYDAEGGGSVPLNPSTFLLGSGGNVGLNAVALVTTTDAKGGNASTAICGKSLQTGNIENINCIQSGTSGEAGTLHSLQTWVVNHPEVQVVAGRETDYMFYATPATNVAAVYADGIQGVNVTGGWSYTSTQVGTPPFTGSRNKINWYLYGSTDASTDFTVSQLSNVYAVINQKSTLGMASELPFITIYTRPDSGTNVGGWYKNKLTYDTLTNSLYDGTTGMKLLYTGADPVGIHPEITGLNRVKLNFDPIFSTVATPSLAYGEGVWLGTLQTNSAAAPNGTRNFVFSEFSMMWEQSAIPLPISQNQVQVFDKALNASAATLVTDLSGITITANKLQVGGTVAVSNFPATQPVSGSVSVSNLPATQAVSGSVSITNLPATQPISGTVAISNFPEGGSNVTIVSPLPTGTNSIGSVTVSNFPAGGSNVSVTNFPATQAVTGTFYPATQPVSGTVAISNFPAGGSNVTVVSALPAGNNKIGKTLCLGSDGFTERPLPVISTNTAEIVLRTLPLNEKYVDFFNNFDLYSPSNFGPTNGANMFPKSQTMNIYLSYTSFTGMGNPGAKASIVVQMSPTGGQWFDSPYVFEFPVDGAKSKMLMCKNMFAAQIRLCNVDIDGSASGIAGCEVWYETSLF